MTKPRSFKKRFPGAYLFMAKLRAPNGCVLEVEFPLNEADGRAMQTMILELGRKHVARGNDEVTELFRNTMTEREGVAFDADGVMKCNTRFAVQEGERLSTRVRYVDPAAGSDDNSGADSTHALKTFAKLDG